MPQLDLVGIVGAIVLLLVSVISGLKWVCFELTGLLPLLREVARKIHGPF